MDIKVMHPAQYIPNQLHFRRHLRAGEFSSLSLSKESIGHKHTLRKSATVGARSRHGKSKEKRASIVRGFCSRYNSVLGGDKEEETNPKSHWWCGHDLLIPTLPCNSI